jgi:hypothetical protein
MHASEWLRPRNIFLSFSLDVCCGCGSDFFWNITEKKRKFSWTGLHGYKIFRNLQDWLE